MSGSSREGSENARVACFLRALARVVEAHGTATNVALLLTTADGTVCFAKGTRQEVADQLVRADMLPLEVALQ